ncbi:MAG TPA: PHP domain-containing protein [Candidatus Angelobacter sp.]|nr:PHP domain-containing protein [Candidatus Angelobacter sp.]
MIDLHTHTTFSDGTSTPEALLQEARSIGLRALAITDHDTFSGFDAVLPLAPQHGIELICGLELSTQVYVEQIGRSSQVHLLGYFLGQLPPPHFREWLTTISSLRYARNLKLMAHLQAKNLAIDWPDFPLPPQTLSRTHFANVLLAKGYVPDRQRAFDLYLSDEMLGGIERKLPSVAEGIERICGAGGLPSLAHPVRLPFHHLALRSFIQEMTGCGLRALEVYHSDHKPEDTNKFLQLTADFGLLATGGSDYHGQNKPDIMLGKGRGNLCLAYTLLEAMKESVKDRHSPFS